MATNKRISRRRSNSAKDLTLPGKTAPKRLGAKERAQQLADEVHRLEVAIVATTRLAREHRVRNADTLPALERRGRPTAAQLTLTQKRSRRHRFYLQTAQFVVTSSLLAGAGAWLYKLWQSFQG